MTSPGIISLISKSNQMLAQRQTAIAQNVANVNTPGYRALDVQEFSDVLSSEGVALSQSHRSHLGSGDAASLVSEVDLDPGNEAGATHSGNNVSLEREMLKAGEVSGRFALGTSLYKSFHRMMISAAR
jgi:flagellar basal-body rod protein FlgB